MRWAFPYCSSMRLLHVCQQTSIQVQPSCETGSWSSTYGGAGLSPHSCSGINVGLVNAARCPQSCCHVESECKRLPQRGGEGRPAGGGSWGHPGPFRLLMDVILYCRHVKYCSLIGWQLCVKIIHVVTVQVYCHSNRTDTQVFNSYTPGTFSVTPGISLETYGAFSRPTEPTQITTEELLRATGGIQETAQFEKKKKK